MLQHAPSSLSAFLITTPCTITILFWSESTFKNKEIDRNERNHVMNSIFFKI